jgi:hypothetical protein
VNTVGGSGATFSSLTVNAPGLNDKLSVSLPITAAGNSVQPSDLTASAALKIKLGSAIGVKSSVNPGVVGSAITFTVLVVGNGRAVPTGIVRVYVGSVSTVTETLVDGRVTVSSDKLPAGAQEIIAEYSGDQNYSSARATLSEYIDKENAGITFTATPNPVSFGSELTLKATVATVAGLTPTGTVKFLADDVELGVVAMVAGTASYKTGTLKAGTHAFEAEYSGSADYKGSAATTTATVERLTPTVTLASSANPSAAGKSVAFTVTVTTPTREPIATGTVEFYYGSKMIGYETLAGGKAKFSTSTLPKGNNTISAHYLGDAVYSPAISANLVQGID